jgi:hypothetical protein
LPSFEDIAIQLRVTTAKTAEIIATLVKAGLLDKTETGFAPHNWNGRQFKSDVSTDRVKRFRNGKRNVSCNVSETPPDTDTDTDTEKKKETRASALIDDGWPKDFREQFWNRYPNKVGKPKALAKLEIARKRKVSWSAVMGGLDRYIREKPADRAWLNPETFINQERWRDQPASAGQRHGASHVDPSEINWDTVLTSFKRFGVWSKHAGPDLDSPGCRAPPEMLAKYGLSRARVESLPIQNLRSMDA